MEQPLLPFAAASLFNDAADYDDDEASAEVYWHVVHSIMHGDNAAMTPVLEFMGENSEYRATLLSALCVSRQWLTLAVRDNTARYLRCTSKSMHFSRSICWVCPDDLAKAVAGIRLENMTRKTRRVVKGGLPSEMLEAMMMGGPVHDPDEEPEVCLRCPDCDGIVDCDDEAWACRYVACMCCAKWFNSEEVKLIDAEDTDVHDLRLKYAGKTTLLCPECWASEYDSPRPPTVQSLPTAEELKTLPNSRGDAEWQKLMREARGLHDRCTHCSKCVRVTSTGADPWFQFGKCECRPCTRCTRWINDDVDDEATRPCRDGECEQLLIDDDDDDEEEESEESGEEQ